MAQITRDEEDQAGDCTCAGRIEIDDDGKCVLSNVTKMTGTSGTGTGVIQMQLFAADGTTIYNQKMVLSVGSDFLRGIARKNTNEEFTIDRDILNKTKYVAFRVKAFETSGWDSEWVLWGVLGAAIIAGTVAGAGGFVFGNGWVAWAVSWSI